jgi:hypothetical protein
LLAAVAAVVPIFTEAEAVAAVLVVIELQALLL